MAEFVSLDHAAREEAILAHVKVETLQAAIPGDSQGNKYKTHTHKHTHTAYTHGGKTKSGVMLVLGHPYIRVHLHKQPPKSGPFLKFPSQKQYFSLLCTLLTT